jgi:hypothetical protein
MTEPTEEQGGVNDILATLILAVCLGASFFAGSWLGPKWRCDDATIIDKGWACYNTTTGRYDRHPVIENGSRWWGAKTVWRCGCGCDGEHEALPSPEEYAKLVR